MTRKDYVKLADAIQSAFNECRSPAERVGVEFVRQYIQRVLADDNPRFDYTRFEKACGVEATS